MANIVVWPRAFARFRRPFLRASLLRVHGKVQRDGLVIHVVAERIVDLDHRLASLQAPAFADALSRGGEAGRPHPEPVYPSRDFR